VRASTYEREREEAVTRQNTNIENDIGVSKETDLYNVQ
jgi:hypothetical protein